jgi:uncharacterized protein (DUF488 family)
MNPESAEKRLFSIGHSNQSSEEFLRLLRLHGIEVVVDIRSQPYSKYATHFNHEDLKATVSAAGLKYLFLGKELGGRPEQEDFYDTDHHVLYERLAEAPLFQEGVERVKKGAEKFAVALMCSEEDPSVCHRHLLIGRVLMQQGVAYHHIRGDGRIQTEEELARQKAELRKSVQPTLFDMEEQEVWRSLRPVPARRQNP